LRAGARFLQLQNVFAQRRLKAFMVEAVAKGLDTRAAILPSISSSTPPGHSGTWMRRCQVTRFRTSSPNAVNAPRTPCCVRARDTRRSLLES
jgi:hypothetical protein